jgi:intracellular septation protein
MKLLFDFLPIGLFYIAYKLYGIYVATGVAIAASILQVAYSRIKNKQFDMVQVIFLFTIALLGGATIMLHNEIFIKLKPTIVYWILAGLLIATSLFSKKPLIQKLTEKNIDLPPAIWRKLTVAWLLFFVTMGGANLFVVYHFSTDTWANFKLFGIPGLSLVFTIAQFVYLAKYLQLKPDR